MARRERGIFRMIFWNFINSLKPHTGKRVLVGEDYFGTKYYEAHPTSVSAKKKAIRSFEPVEKENHEQELPAEWEAWLRHRRRNAPTKEEIEASYKLAITKKENARKIEETFSITESKQLDAPNQPQGFHSFPLYQEYEHHGQNYKPKRKK